MKIKAPALSGIALLTAALAISVGYLALIARTGTGYEAETVCSAVFVSGRDPSSLRNQEFEGLNPLLKLIHPVVDRAHGEVRASLMGLAAQRAAFRPGLGCTLADFNVDLPAAPPIVAMRRHEPDDVIAKGVVAGQAGVNASRLSEAVDRAFAEPDPAHPRRTRALLVVKDGKLVAEHYASGFDKDMPLAGYSMTKTITGALTGILIGRGLLSPEMPVPIPLWRRPGDPRGAIRIADLLDMTTGQSWSEDVSDPLSPVLVMSYHKRDAAAYVAALPLTAPPGSRFAYNSGSTNLLSRVPKTALGDDPEKYLALPRTALFDPAGMSSALISTDEAGTFLGHASGFATARDWARFGELYLNDGARNGVQVLPKGWVAYSETPSPAGMKRGYGAQLWVNKGPPGNPQLRPRPSLPEDTILMNGQFGQLTAVIASRRVVIVRLGETHHWDFARDPDALVVDILASLPD